MANRVPMLIAALIATTTAAKIAQPNKNFACSNIKSFNDMVFSGYFV